MAEQSSADALYKLGKHYEKQKDYQTAIDRFCRSYDIEPDASTANDISVCYWELKDMESSAFWIQEALKLDEYIAAAHYNYAVHLEYEDAYENVESITDHLFVAAKLDPSCLKADIEFFKQYLSEKTIQKLTKKSSKATLPLLLFASLLGAGVANSARDTKMVVNKASNITM